MGDYWPHFTFLALLEIAVTISVITWVLMTKRDSTVAMAWALVVLLVPLIGAVLFFIFGYTRVHRPLKRRRRQRARFRTGHPPTNPEAAHGKGGEAPQATWNDIGQLALHVSAFPVSPGNRVQLFHDTNPAFAALLEDIRQAKHHVHVQFYIFRNDATGRQLIALLAEKARQGVEVRVLYDGIGGFGLPRRMFRPLREAGGKVDSFLPLRLTPFRLRVNLRNHRKIVVVDGRVGFTGGMNIGDEYLGLDRYFGYWRDTFLRLEGPAVAGLQRVFVEDWDFAHGEAVNGGHYFPAHPREGSHTVQVIESGPDQEIQAIRQIFFASILSARERIWIATPYIVPDLALLDALRLARYRGVEIRLLTLIKPDHFLSFHGSRYYYEDLLSVGVHIHLYTRGMMHAKVLIVDGEWGLVGSANLDNRSLRLNFEIGCLLHSPELVQELETAFQQDLADSVLLDASAFARRSFWHRLAENACRLLSPTL